MMEKLRGEGPGGACGAGAVCRAPSPGGKG